MSAIQVPVNTTESVWKDQIKVYTLYQLLLRSFRLSSLENSAMEMQVAMNAFVFQEHVERIVK